MASTKRSGEQKLSSAAASGNGGAQLAADESRPTAASSETYQTNEKASTKRGANLTPEMTLQILQQSILNCQKAGIRVQVFNDEQHRRLVLVLANVALNDGDFELTASTGGKP